MASKSERAVAESVSAGKDTFNEALYSAAHFPLPLVLQLLKETVATERTTQRFILLEGFGNSSKLAEEDDQLALRQMDEFFCIENALGEVAGVVDLT